MPTASDYRNEKSARDLLVASLITMRQAAVFAGLVDKHWQERIEKAANELVDMIPEKREPVKW